MGIFSSLFNYSTGLVTSKPTYNYLVVAALQEELNAFFDLTSHLSKKARKEGGAIELIYKKGKREIKILAYSPNKMGMPYNAAAIMRIILLHQPIYTFFIGTCAGLYKDKQKPGDILIPHFIFNYESGKHTANGDFQSDYVSFETDDEIRKFAEIIKNRVSKQYNVTTDENFCSGGAIVDNHEKKEKIIKDSARKVSGLDMEAFSIACINSILKEEGKKLSVIKGIMDFGEDKSESEKEQNKKLAKINSAKFALELIDYIDDNIMGINQDAAITNISKGFLEMLIGIL